MVVHERYDPSLPPIQADADLAGQALRNLLDNARCYAPDGAEVAVTMTPRGTTVRVAVSNTGGEISAEDLPHIFERFYRGEKSRSRETGGVGIGLALVQEIARAHGGEAGAESGGGVTTVWFSLALRPATAATMSAVPPRPRRTAEATRDPAWAPGGSGARDRGRLRC